VLFFRESSASMIARLGKLISALALETAMLFSVKQGTRYRLGPVFRNASSARLRSQHSASSIDGRTLTKQQRASAYWMVRAEAVVDRDRARLYSVRVAGGLAERDLAERVSTAATSG